ncbi:amidohydrolase family protein [Acidisoma cellulosilytica]|uniref:Amidohydrolase family protein n=1 Tax=Acidisoma cellulosilyticum TaxID=2802395 RepID=A0A963Z1S2_9PROT|nr:amidohydrolase family protein [Acidisoma cellulosilyticum]MCB8881119.1 amidohydrolase family protein [Acidisoma cellulosilyticum]
MFDDAYREANFPVVRPDWLALRREDVIDAGQPIIDAHHHLWDEPLAPYQLPDLIADAKAGHRIAATVYVEAKSHLRDSGPDHLKPVGETEFAAGCYRVVGETRFCAAIVGFTDLTCGGFTQECLEAHVAAGQGRFRGVRARAAWHAHPALRPPADGPPAGLLADPAFQQGAAQLAQMGLTLDIWVFHTQLPEVAALARALPDLPMVINHCGGPLGIGPFQGQRTEVFQSWQKDLASLTRFDNLHVKLGGLGMPRIGFGFQKREAPPDSQTVATAWGPYFAACIEAFGPNRCMFESNFPVDKGAISYPILWNALKLASSQYSATEKNALFSETAANFYKIK